LIHDCKIRTFRPFEGSQFAMSIGAEEHAVADAPWDVPEEFLLGQFIPLHYHFNMLGDSARMDGFQEAIQNIVPVGGKVLELGGGTGVLSWFAAQRAAKVWCVERNPALVRAARKFLKTNPNGERVEVIQSDATSWLPPEPVDVVICEMLHVALVREKQIEVLRSFKERYTEAFGPKLPTFLPDAALLAVQPVQQNFSFHGYTAPVPMFQAGLNSSTQPLTEPEIYSTIYYEQSLPDELLVEAKLVIRRGGTLNALLFLTKNFLAFLLAEKRAVEWMMHHLIVPIAHPFEVAVGESVSIRFSYRPGCSLEMFMESVNVVREAPALRILRAA